MANFCYKRTTEDKVVIKGELSSDGTKVIVTEKEDTKEILIKNYLDKFVGEYVEITVKTKSEDDLLEDED